MLFVAVVALVITVWGIRLVGQVPSGPAAQAPVTTAAISGSVTNAANGRPIPGVIVSLRFGAGVPGLAPSLARTRRQLSDALGRFVFKDLPGIDGYSIATSRVGFVDGAYGQTAAFGPTGTINLKDGQWFDRADVVMWKPGAIGGRVLDERGDAVVGIFVRALAQQFVAGTPRLLAGASAKTDDRGEYRIAGLVPGRYLVMVPSVQSTVSADLPASALAQPTSASSALERQLMFGGVLGASPRVDAALDLDPAYRLIVGNFPTPPAATGRPQSYPITFFPSASAAASASVIELGLSQERRGVDIALQPVPAARIAGTVDGPRDQLSGMLLRLMPTGLEDLAIGSEAATTTVGADGRFVFLNVPNGSYTIDTRRASTELTMQSASSGPPLPMLPGPVSLTSGSQSGNVVSGPPGAGYVTRDGGAGDLFWTRTPVSVSGDMAGLVVTLHPTITIHGRMIFEGTTRQMVQEQAGGAAVGGATRTVVSGVTERPFRLPTVYAEPASAETSLGIPRSTANEDTTVADSFSLGGLRAGEYVLRVNQGSGRYMVKSITMGGQDITERPVDVSTPRGATDLVITFTDQVITVNGFVQGDPASTPKAAVIAFPIDRAQWAKFGLTPKRMHATPSEPSTGFSIQGLPAGEYFFVAVDRSLTTAWQDPAFLERAAAVATRVKVDWGDTQSVTLPFSRIR